MRLCVYILYWRAKEKLVFNITQTITIFNIFLLKI